MTGWSSAVVALSRYTIALIAGCTRWSLREERDARLWLQALVAATLRSCPEHFGEGFEQRHLTNPAMITIVFVVFCIVYLGMILGGLPFLQLDRTGIALL